MYDNAAIRQTVIDAASKLGVSDAAIVKTVILTRDGYFAGHRFLFDGIQATWSMAEGVVRVYADDGVLLKTVEVGQGRSMKKAA